MVSRRDFINLMSKAALIGIAAPGQLLAASWSDSWDGEVLPDTVDMESPPAKQAYCEGCLRLKSAIHGEAYEFRYRDCSGNFDHPIVEALNWFLRCRDGSWVPMDITAIETLNYLSQMLGKPVIQINSGYRSPEYNLLLAARNENVARNSLHQYGRAIDFCVPGMPIRKVCSYAQYARNTIGVGGIGYYPRTGFVHLDSGPARNWVK
jgi:uncharacterized protein YcbK (DUF882 family)